MLDRQKDASTINLCLNLATKTYKSITVTPSFQNTPEHFRNDIHEQNEGVPGFIHASFLVSQPRGLFQLLGCAQLVHKHHNLLRDWRRVQVIHARVPYLTLFVNRKAHWQPNYLTYWSHHISFGKKTWRQCRMLLKGHIRVCNQPKKQNRLQISYQF